MKIKSRTATYQLSGFKLTQLGYRDALRVSPGLPSGQVALLTDHEAISYNTGGEFNYCLHNVETTFDSGFPAKICSYINLRQKYRRSFPGGEPPEPIPNAYESQMACWNYWKWPVKTTGYDNSEYELAKHDAYTRLMHIRSAMGERHMNVARSAMELKDTKQTLGQLMTFMYWVKSRIGTRVSIAKPFTRKVQKILTMKDTVVACASAYLWYRFGVEPTVADVRRFIKELSQGKLRVRGYKNPIIIPKGQTVRARYRCAPRLGQIYELMYPDRHAWTGSLEIDPYLGHTWPGEETITWPPSAQITGDFPAHRVDVSEISGVYFAKLKKSITIDGLSEMRKRWEWSCPSFSTLWDLVPFSFLVDWVVDVGAFIERLEKRYVMQNYAEFLGPVWLAEERRTVRYYPRLVGGELQITGLRAPADSRHGGLLNTTWSISGGVWRGGSTRRTFERHEVKDTPTTVFPKLGESLTAYQISTGMALLAQFAGKFR